MVSIDASRPATRNEEMSRATTASLQALFSSENARWDAVVERDARADDVFYYSVATTGVYCRPSCAARLARRENVAFHDSCAAAERAGFRPCKRCWPNEVRSEKNGIPTRMRFAAGDCTLGKVLVAATENGICAILLGDDNKALVDDLRARFPRTELTEERTELEPALAQAARVIESPELGIEVPLDVCGTAFQRRVWRALREIPSGKTASYMDIATRIGSPKSVRAVARACASNPIAVAIPCHRVVRSDGDLSGYRWGVERKQALLARELTN